MAHSSEDIMNALYDYGVDSWEGYDAAVDLFDSWVDDDSVEAVTDEDPDLMLSALESCGVDNWDGYSDAIQNLKENEDEEN